MPHLILASTSPYRKALLTRLGIPFSCIPPEVDESPQIGESASILAERLSIEKALKISAKHPEAIVIGSDQTLECNGHILGKPGNFENALKQLQILRGNDAVFYTALCMTNAKARLICVVPTCVHYKESTDEELSRYLVREQPYQCAGSAQAEGLGIVLAHTITSDDPTALIGLPLLSVARFLEKFNYPVL